MNDARRKIIAGAVLTVFLTGQIAFLPTAKAQSAEEIGRVIGGTFTALLGSAAIYGATYGASYPVCYAYDKAAGVLKSVFEAGKKWLFKKAKEKVLDTIGIKAGIDFVPVIDKTHIDATKTHIDATKTQTTESNVKSCQDFLLDTATLIIKKRILDVAVDQITVWIQGGGMPLFVTDYQSFLADAGNAAVGDFVQKIGLSALCSPYKFQLQLALYRPRQFSEKAACTLDKIIENFDAFKQDFAKGGFPAYVKMLEPQNNIYGAYIMAYKEKEFKAEEAIAAAEKEITAGRGFLSQKKCLFWSAVDDTGNVITQADNGRNKAPDDEKNWKCVKAQIITPGSFIGDYVAQNMTQANLGFISGNDIGAYAGEIAQAIINRFTNDLVTKGLGGKSDFTPALSTAPPSETDTNLLTINTAITEIKNLLNEIRSTLNQINLDQTKTDIESIHGEFGVCYARKYNETNHRVLEQIGDKILVILGNYQGAGYAQKEVSLNTLNSIFTTQETRLTTLEQLLTQEPPPPFEKTVNELNEISIILSEGIGPQIEEFNNQLKNDKSEMEGLLAQCQALSNP